MLITFRITITKVDRVSWVCTLALVRVCASNRRSYASAETLGESKRTGNCLTYRTSAYFERIGNQVFSLFASPSDAIICLCMVKTLCLDMLQVMQLHVFETTLESVVCFEHLQCI